MTLAELKTLLSVKYDKNSSCAFIIFKQLLCVVDCKCFSLGTVNDDAPLLSRMQQTYQTLNDCRI